MQPNIGAHSAESAYLDKFKIHNMKNNTQIETVNAQGNIVEIKNAVVAQEDNIVLRDVNLNIKRGEFVYLIGKVGSGKTSLLKTLYCELPFSGDMCYVAGFDLKKIKRNQIPFLRRKMGIVFQDFQLLADRTVYDNLSFVLHATGWNVKYEMDKRIREVLTQVEMVNKGYKMPHQLSGGEQQRVAIARALLNHPDLILADEPTGNLDPETTDNLMTILHQISKEGKTIIMATHNLSVTKKFLARTLKCENMVISEVHESEVELDFN